jgi:cell fate regulator YaaT (PSP1 superfamily)
MVMATKFLVRYGSVPEVARFVCPGAEQPERGEQVVVRTHRGLQLGQVLNPIPQSSPEQEDEDSDFEIVRRATPEDETIARESQTRCEGEFYEWCRRILLWNLPLELIDLERTLDGDKLILYVLTERGPATTNLALQAAAEGLGLIEVQPVSATGLEPVEKGGGCGSGDCGCHT